MATGLAPASAQALALGSEWVAESATVQAMALESETAPSQAAESGPGQATAIQPAVTQAAALALRALVPAAEYLVPVSVSAAREWVTARWATRGQTQADRMASWREPQA